MRNKPLLRDVGPQRRNLRTGAFDLFQPLLDGFEDADEMIKVLSAMKTFLGKKEAALLGRFPLLTFSEPLGKLNFFFCH
jgi:hypothetical protein